MDFLKNLKDCRLFEGFTDYEIEQLLHCIKVKQSVYEKYQYVFEDGNQSNLIGVVLSGEIRIISDDYWGNRTILGRVETGDIFGEAFAFSKISMPVSVVANQKSEVLLINANKILTPCRLICDYHTKLINNTVQILANKNTELIQKMKHITKRTTKDKLLSYLSLEAQKANNNVFIIPFSREELANFLSVDRSAMSNELCKLRDNGIIEFKKNKFKLNQINL